MIHSFNQEHLLWRLLRSTACALIAATATGAHPADVSPSPHSPTPELNSGARQPNDPVSTAKAALQSAPLRTQQKAIRRLGESTSPEADSFLLSLLTQLSASKLHPGLWLEVLEATEKRSSTEIRQWLKNHSLSIASSSDPLRAYWDCIQGGSASRGEEIFSEDPEAGCIRCHTFRNKGTPIGPDLTGIGGTLERIYILQSIIDPNATIAPGYQHVIVEMRDGSSASGILRSEDPETVHLRNPSDGATQSILTADILSLSPLPSAMPPNLATTLGKRKIRDLVEFLAEPAAP